MSKSKNTVVRKALASVSAAALGLLGVVGLAAAASAAVGPDQPEAPSEGSLTIHKLLGSQGLAGNGTELEDLPDGTTPLGGVEFTYWQLGTVVGGECVALDLADAAAWDSVPTGIAPGLTGAGVPDVGVDGLCLVAPTAGTAMDLTGENGQTTETLPLGLYYVAETDVSGAYTMGVDENGDPARVPVTVVSGTAPFYVAIPTPLPGEEGENGEASAADWRYNVHVYPKNQTLDEPSKEINEDDTQEGLVVGSTVEWTITQNVPSLNEGETYDSASIYEVLDPELLEYAATTEVTLNGVPLTPGTDYRIDEGTVGSYATVTWVFLKPVLDSLAANDTLNVVFTTTVLKVTENGDIENPGSEGSTPGYGSEFNGSKIPGGPTPATYWGALEVEKADQDGNALAGAEFKVTAAPESGVCPAMSATVPAATDVVSTGVSEAGTGLVLWTPNRPTDGTSPLGLFVHNTNDETEDPSDFSKIYCLYETGVPAGYDGIPVETVEITPGTVNTVEYTGDDAIKNVQKKGPELPKTGAAGTVLMTVGGLVLIAVAGGLLLANRRKTATK